MKLWWHTVSIKVEHGEHFFIHWSKQPSLRGLSQDILHIYSFSYRHPGIFIPVLDLFNHHQEQGNVCEFTSWKDTEQVTEESDWVPENFVMLQASRDYAPGEEVWNSYGKLTEGAFETLIKMNFLPSRNVTNADGTRKEVFSESMLDPSEDPTGYKEDRRCEDMIYFRYPNFDGTKKARCLADARLSFESVLRELQWAIEHRDRVTLKGLGAWLDRNIIERPSSPSSKFTTTNP